MIKFVSLFFVRISGSSGWSFRFAFGRPGVHSLVESYQKTLTNGNHLTTASLLGARHLRDIAEKKPANSFVVSLGKALNGASSPLCRRQVVHVPPEWQLPSDCGHLVQKTAM